ncbi:MAG: HlyC/CorC family transporter [Oligoflexales bacterium]|nr:HlyC/CorC family transporter [Oligoflexales bacterium]
MEEFIFTDDVVQLTILVVCLLLSAFFSSSETAITSTGTLKASHLIDSGDPRAKALRLWVSRPNHVLTTILLGNNIVNILSTALATNLATKYFASQAIGIATGVMTFLIVVFGEIMPKSFAKNHSTQLAIIAMRILNVIYIVLYPVVLFFSMLAETGVKLLGSKFSDQPLITEEELEYMVKVSEKTGVIEKIKKNMLAGVFEFDETKVREIMTPRPDMTAVEAQMALEDVLKIAIETGYSRIPVYSETIDKIEGILLVKDLLAYALENKSLKKFQLQNLMRKALFFPESRSISEAFKSLKKDRQHVAIVVDEYGGTAGLVTLEDIIEVIVGDIQDEFDEETEKIIDLSGGIYDVSGSVNLEDFLEYFDISPEDVKEEIEGDIDTLAGWLTKMTQSMPKLGQTVTIGPLKAEVTAVERHRIQRLRITRILSVSNHDTDVPEKSISEQDKAALV